MKRPTVVLFPAGRWLWDEMSSIGDQAWVPLALLISLVVDPFLMLYTVPAWALYRAVRPWGRPEFRHDAESDRWVARWGRRIYVERRNRSAERIWCEPDSDMASYLSDDIGASFAEHMDRPERERLEALFDDSAPGRGALSLAAASNSPTHHR